MPFPPRTELRSCPLLLLAILVMVCPLLAGGNKATDGRPVNASAPDDSESSTKPAEERNRLLPAPSRRRSEDRPSVRAVRVEKGPVIDGILDDEVWSLAEPSGDLTQVYPVTGATPTFRTEFRVLYDADHLYFCIWCHDDAPHKILAREMAPDSPVWVDDHVRIAIDTARFRIARRHASSFSILASCSASVALSQLSNA